VSALLYKGIKPQKLKTADLRLSLLNEMRKVGTEIKKDFEKTTATWQHKPKFETVVSLMQPGPTVLVGTDDEIYGYVSKGTKPHPIFAGIYTGKSNKKALAFPSKFSPKTRPGVIGSTAGSRGGDMVVRPYVQHPGTKPRNFEEAIEKIWKKKFKKRMEAAMREVAQKSGYGL
jgi:hypothetical protein